MPGTITPNGLETINLGANEFDFDGADRGPTIWSKFNANVLLLDTALTELERVSDLMTILEEHGFTDGFINGGVA